MRVPVAYNIFTNLNVKVTSSKDRYKTNVCYIIPSLMFKLPFLKLLHRKNVHIPQSVNGGYIKGRREITGCLHLGLWEISEMLYNKYIFLLLLITLSWKMLHRTKRLMMKTSSLLLHSYASLSPVSPSLHSYNCFLASKDVLKSLICCLILFILWVSIFSIALLSFSEISRGRGN